MNDRPHRVVGVLPPLPAFPRVDDVYMPTTACPFRARAAASGDAGIRMIPLLFGRLRGGADVATAEAELVALMGALERRDPDAYGPGNLLRIQLDPMQSALTATARPLLLLLLATAGLVLLNATANVANVVLARLLRREQELALRHALSAAPGQVVRLVLGEALGLVILGLSLGIAGSLAVGSRLSEWLAAGGGQDPALVALVSLTLIAVTGAACLFPARRAAAIDPMAAVAPE